MVEIIASNTYISNNLGLKQKIVSYLDLLGNKSKEKSEKWLVYIIKGKEVDNPTEIILPADQNTSDYDVYFRNAVNILSAFFNESAEKIFNRINYFSSDVLFHRVLDTGGFNSIPLELASEQIEDLKHLVAYSAWLEKSPKPYFLYNFPRASLKMTEQYRFGHTFSGSFGFTIESPILTKPMQLNLYSDSIAEPLMPLERRVMERIIRGLLITKEATQKRDVNLLIDEYASGFNSNMCSTIVKLSQKKKIQVEYSVQWSPKYRPAKILAENEVIRLNEENYIQLEYAAQMLKKLKPEKITISGHIIALTAKNNPLGTDTIRYVVIRGKPSEEAHPIDVSVELNKEDYINASSSHLQWQSVKVSGILSRSGNAWRLSDYKNFQIL